MNIIQEAKDIIEDFKKPYYIPSKLVVDDVADLLSRLVDMLEWKPIDEEKKLKQGMKRIYTFRPKINEKRPYASLSRTYDFSGVYGYRKCDYYIDIPLPPVGDK